MAAENYFKKLEDDFEKLPVWGSLNNDLFIESTKVNIESSLSHLGVRGYEVLSKNKKFISILATYLTLSNCVRRLIIRMSKGAGEDEANLSKLSIVEIETRVLLLKAHTSRLVEESEGSEFSHLIDAGVTAALSFLPEVSALHARLLVYGSRELDKTFTDEVLFQQKLVSMLIEDIGK